MTILLILIGKLISFVSKLLNKGSGSTWPGELALIINPKFVKKITLKNPNLKIILIAGTNGKTTTSLMIYEILKAAGYKVFRNESGANLLNGIASSLIKNSSLSEKINYDFGIFEVDENNLPLVLENLNPYAILLLNLFRDQLDRYGELNGIAKKWESALQKDNFEHLILNADDPLMTYIGYSISSSRTKRGDLSKIASSHSVPRKDDITYFGLPENLMTQKTLIHGADSIYCPNCGEKLIYKKVAYSHLGKYNCPKCKFKNPLVQKDEILRLTQDDKNFPLPGLYNKYNTLAAVTLAKSLDLKDEVIEKGLENIKPAFGRQEKIEIDAKFVQIFLSKNPTSFNQSLETIIGIEKNPNVLFVLNDRIPDGRDVSWIWDIDLESYIDKLKNITISGDRCYDMGLRVNYSMEFPISNSKINQNIQMFEDLQETIKAGLDSIESGETLYVLPTYSAMLEVRKILTGKKIL